ncbi:hypothetical protein R6Q57_017010 [Mikania cordata]
MTNQILILCSPISPLKINLTLVWGLPSPPPPGLRLSGLPSRLSRLAPPSTAHLPVFNSSSSAVSTQSRSSTVPLQLSRVHHPSTRTILCKGW